MLHIYTQVLVLLLLSGCRDAPPALDESARGDDLRLQADEANWPQWRGPERTDLSTDSGLLQEWPAGGPPRLWLFESCGVGFSGPAVVGTRLYIMGARETGGGERTEQLFCLDAVNAKELWKTDVGELFEVARGNGPRSTPTAVGERVLALGGQGNLVCVGAKDGELQWRASMTDLGGALQEWGYCESVLVDGNRVICTPGGERGAVAALDLESGEVLWRSVHREGGGFTDDAQYTSPIVAEVYGTRQYIQLTQKSLVGIAAQTGELLWRSDWPGRTAVITTPIYHDRHVFVTSGYGVGCKLVRLDAARKVSDVYQNKRMKNQHGGVILFDGHLYGYSDDVGWVCQNFATGEIIWREEEKLGKGSIAYADGRFYCLTEKERQVALIEASPKGWSERGRFQLEPASKLRQERWRVWTHPVVTGGRLYLRNQELLFCFDVQRL